MSEQLRKTAAILLNHAEHGLGEPFPQWLVDCRRDVEAAAEAPPPISRKAVTDVQVQIALREWFRGEGSWDKGMPEQSAKRFREEMRQVLEAVFGSVTHSFAEYPTSRKFALGDHVRKRRGSSWQGRVVGFYTTALTPNGYAVESEREPGSVQIYPETALEKADV